MYYLDIKKNEKTENIAIKIIKYQFFVLKSDLSGRIHIHTLTIKITMNGELRN